MTTYKIYVETPLGRQLLTTKISIQEAIRTTDNIINSKPNTNLMVIKHINELDMDEVILIYHGMMDRYIKDREELLLEDEVNTRNALEYWSKVRVRK